MDGDDDRLWWLAAGVATLFIVAMFLALVFW